MFTDTDTTHSEAPPSAAFAGGSADGEASSLSMSLSDFAGEFGDDLLESLNRSNPPVYRDKPRPHRERVLAGLKRKPFPAQAAVVHAVAELLINRGERAAIINGEMGTGKTVIAIAVAAVLHAEGYRRTLVISPPHLVYKWRREILTAIPSARVWVLNGPDTLVKLIQLREQLHVPPQGQEFFVLGRVRMRMGFHWRPAFARRRTPRGEVAHCPQCGTLVTSLEGAPIPPSLLETEESRRKCQQCGGALWTLMRPRAPAGADQSRAVLKALQRIPTIGEVTAQRLIKRFGGSFLASMLGDNLYEFVNLMDGHGELVFSDRQAQRMERAMANMEFGFGEGGYQASEYIKRYLPQGTFDLVLCDEAHEYKNAGSAQGQAMGVLAAKARKIVCLTGTLMGGYADDLFYLLFRALPERMIEDGYRPNKHGSLTSAAMAFMRDHGVLKDIYTEQDAPDHKTARGKKPSVHTSKAPGFGPQGILRTVLPFTVFLKLRDIGGNVLPPYHEELREIAMDPPQAQAYQRLSGQLTSQLKQALALRDKTLLGVVLNVLLAWPDTCFRSETVKHPRTRASLAFVPSIFTENERMPKERALIEQEDLMQQIVDIAIPASLPATVGDALRYVLERSGYRLCQGNADTDALNALPLPAAHLHLGPLKLHEALQILIGPARELTVDEVTREVCIRPHALRTSANNTPPTHP